MMLSIILSNRDIRREQKRLDRVVKRRQEVLARLRKVVDAAKGDVESE